MTVINVNAKTYTGLSTDTKPTSGVVEGTAFYETDTLLIYTMIKSSWINTGRDWYDEKSILNHIKNNKFLMSGLIPTTGYTRRTPYFVEADDYGTLIGFNGACDNVTRNQVLGPMNWFGTNAPPTTAVALVFAMDCQIKAVGGVGVTTTHEINCESLLDHAGTLLHQDLAFACVERVGDAAGLWIGGGQAAVTFPVTGPNLEITTRFFDSGGTASIIQGMHLIGYYEPLT